MLEQLSQRDVIGRHELHAIDGPAGEEIVERVGQASFALADGLVNFAFGQVFARAELSRRERELITVGMLAALGGAEPQLAVHARAALRCGADADELLATIEHVVSYAGFPRALNGLRVVREILQEQERPLPLPAFSLGLRDHETLVTDTRSEGEPLVLLHSLGLDRRVWRDVIRQLPGRRVIAYDLRGHGYAAAAPQPAALDSYVDDLLAVMDRLGLDRVQLAGLSLGGSIALQAGLRAPERFSRLSVLCATHETFEVFEQRAQLAERDGIEAGLAETLTRWFTPEALAVNGWAVRYARDRVLRNRVEDWAAAWRALAGISLNHRLATLSVPLQVIAGGEDRSTPPALMKGIAEAVPGAQFNVVEGSPHMLPLERPEATAALLRTPVIERVGA